MANTSQTKAASAAERIEATLNEVLEFLIVRRVPQKNSAAPSR